MTAEAPPSAGTARPSRRGNARPGARRASRRRSWLIGAIAAGLAACGVLPPADLVAPRVSVADVSVRDLGLEEIRFELTLDTDNPNDVDVPLTDLVFDLDLFGRSFAVGRTVQRSITLARGARTAIPVQFTVPTSRLLDALRELRLEGGAPLAYRLRGSARWGASPFPVRFERAGDLDALRKLRDLLQLLPRA